MESFRGFSCFLSESIPVAHSIRSAFCGFCTLPVHCTTTELLLKCVCAGCCKVIPMCVIFHTGDLPTVFPFLHNLLPIAVKPWAWQAWRSPLDNSCTPVPLCWTLKSPLRSDKVSPILGLDPSRTTEELQEAVLVTQLMAVLLLVQHWADAPVWREKAMFAWTSFRRSARWGLWPLCFQKILQTLFVGTKIGVPFLEAEVVKEMWLLIQI